MTSHSLVRTIYLYLFALLGLVLATIGGVRLVDLALKATVFTQAEDEQKLYTHQPPMPPIAEVGARIAKMETEGEGSAEERAALRQWVEEYEAWREASREIDPIAARRQRDASSGLAMLVIGIPLYLFHWRLIRRQMTER